MFGKLKRSEVTLKYEQFSIFQDIEEEKLKIAQKRKSWANVVKGGGLKKSAPVPTKRDGRMKERTAKKETLKLGEMKNIDAGQKRKLDRQESLKPSQKKQKKINKMEDCSGATENFESESPGLFECNTSGRLLTKNLSSKKSSVLELRFFESPLKVECPTFWTVFTHF